MNEQSNTLRMKLTDQVTSLSLAKRLKEFGVKQESYFRHVKLLGSVETWQIWNEKGWSRNIPYDQEKVVKELWNEGIAAFTVAELGEMLPEYTESYRTISENVYRVVYCDEVFEEGETMFEADTEAEARGLMLAYLIENNLMSV